MAPNRGGRRATGGCHYSRGERPLGRVPSVPTLTLAQILHSYPYFPLFLRLSPPCSHIIDLTVICPDYTIQSILDHRDQILQIPSLVIRIMYNDIEAIS